MQTSQLPEMIGHTRRLIRSIMKQGLIVSILAGLVISICVILVMQGPEPYTFHDGDWDNMQFEPEYNRTEWTITLDAHSHTTISDGRLSPEQNIQWHIAHGFNAAIITDHNTILGALIARDVAREKYNDTIKILIGLEWTTDRIHFTLVGNTPDFINYFSPANFPRVRDRPTDGQIRAIITTTHTLGGVVIVNHFERGRGHYRPSFDELVDWGVDYFEILNEGHAYYKELHETCLARKIGVITGSDMHDPTEIRVNGWTLLNTTEFTEDAIFEELKTGRTAILYDPVGVPYTAYHDRNPWSIPIMPLVTLGRLFMQFVNWPRFDYLNIMLFFGYTDGSGMAWGYVKERFR